MIERIVFIMLSLLCVVPALLVVTVKNVFHAALFLVLSLTGVGGLFAMLGADFIFVAQILVYTGGILILLMFVVFLSGNPKDWIVKQINGNWAGGLIVSAVFVSMLATLFRFLPEKTGLSESLPTTSSLGILLIRDMVLPFEAISLVLLSALVGAIHFSQRGKE